MTRAELIAALEKAEGPSRELAAHAAARDAGGRAMSKPIDDLLARIRRGLTFAPGTWDRGDMRLLLKKSAAEIARLREALGSIAANTCCDQCKEAALAARAALENGR